VQSRNLLNLLLALILAALAALAFYEPGKAPPAAKPVLTPLQPDEVHQLRIESSNGTSISLIKQQGHWQMTSPYQVAADDNRIERLLAVTSAESQASYSMAQVDANQLQLDSPQLVLTLNGDTVLRFGTTDSLQGRRYVQLGNRVHLIVDRYSHLVRGNATLLVNPQLLAQAEPITQLVLPGLRLTQDSKGWQLTAADDATKQEHSADQLQALVDEWQHARALSLSAIDRNAPVEDKVSIRTTNAELQFALRHADDELIIQRPELGLAYHFSQEAGQRLLQLPAKD
jgi:hypothetical protein